MDGPVSAEGQNRLFSKEFEVPQEYMHTSIVAMLGAAKRVGRVYGVRASDAVHNLDIFRQRFLEELTSYQGYSQEEAERVCIIGISAGDKLAEDLIGYFGAGQAAEPQLRKNFWNNFWIDDSSVLIERAKDYFYGSVARLETVALDDTRATGVESDGEEDLAFKDLEASISRDLIQLARQLAAGMSPLEIGELHGGLSAGAIEEKIEKLRQELKAMNPDVEKDRIATEGLSKAETQRATSAGLDKRIKMEDLQEKIGDIPLPMIFDAIAQLSAQERACLLREWGYFMREENISHFCKNQKIPVSVYYENVTHALNRVREILDHLPNIPEEDIMEQVVMLAIEENPTERIKIPRDIQSVALRIAQIADADPERFNRVGFSANSKRLYAAVLMRILQLKIDGKNPDAFRLADVESGPPAKQSHAGHRLKDILYRLERNTPKALNSSIPRIQSLLQEDPYMVIHTSPVRVILFSRLAEHIQQGGALNEQTLKQLFGKTLSNLTSSMKAMLQDLEQSQEEDATPRAPGEILRFIRVSQGLNGAELAKVLQRTREAIDNLEHNPGVSLKKFIEYLITGFPQDKERLLQKGARELLLLVGKRIPEMSSEGVSIEEVNNQILSLSKKGIITFEQYMQSLEKVRGENFYTDLPRSPFSVESYLSLRAQGKVSELEWLVGYYLLAQYQIREAS